MKNRHSTQSRITGAPGARTRIRAALALFAAAALSVAGASCAPARVSVSAIGFTAFTLPAVGSPSASAQVAIDLVLPAGTTELAAEDAVPVKIQLLYKATPDAAPVILKSQDYAATRSANPLAFEYTAASSAATGGGYWFEAIAIDSKGATYARSN